MNYYISDLHLGHKNIMSSKMSNRPFNSVEEMDEILIKNWNNIVKNEDDIYILGDFCYKSGKNPKEYLNRLNGKKHLIVGNHDGQILRDPVCRKCFVEIKDMLNIKDGNKNLFLCHYPMAEWPGYFRETIHLYGHIHNNTTNDTYKIMYNLKNAYNVGADILDFTPRALQDVIEYNLKFKNEHTI